jgi:hypothetical protein
VVRARPAHLGCSLWFCDLADYLRFSFDNTTTVTAAQTGAQQLDTNKWVHTLVSVTFSATTGSVIKLYRNGVLDTSATVTVPTTRNVISAATVRNKTCMH